jgi:hypothetical protein
LAPVPAPSAILLGVIGLGLSGAAPPATEQCANETCHPKVKTSHARLLGPKAHAEFGCARCHGGKADAPAAEAAHGATGEPDEILRAPYAAAACAGCHVAGAVAGTEALVRGARVYQELGCQLCHRAFGWGDAKAFAPALDFAGLHGAKFLAAEVAHPEQRNRSTVMPAFEHALAARGGEDQRALLTFLLSLRGEARPAPHVPSDASCNGCHAGAKPSAHSGAGPKHRCRFILDQKSELACARCHPKGPPSSEKECLFVLERKRDCGVCHALSGGPGGG